MILFDSPFRFGATGTASAPTKLGTEIGLSGSGTMTTSSFTPTASAQMFVWIASRRGTAVPNPFTCSDSNGGTWTAQLSDTEYDGASTRLRVALYRQRAPSSPTAMTISAGSTLSDHMGMLAFQIVGVTDDNTNFAIDTDTAGDPAPTMTYVPSAGSVTLGLMCVAGAPGATTDPTGYTNLATWIGGTTLRINVCYRVNAPSASGAWVSTGNFSLGALMEVKAV